MFKELFNQDLTKWERLIVARSFLSGHSLGIMALEPKVRLRVGKVIELLKEHELAWAREICFQEFYGRSDSE